jgi:hypothetical protein
MTGENITLLAIGFGLVLLNAVLGPRAAAAIAKLFGGGTHSESEGHSLRPVDLQEIERDADSGHSISGVRLGAAAKGPENRALKAAKGR